MRPKRAQLSLVISGQAMSRDDVEHVLSSHGGAEASAAAAVLDRYNALSSARLDKPYVSPLDPPPRAAHGWDCGDSRIRAALAAGRRAEEMDICDGCRARLRLPSRRPADDR